jgi:hypothetical protein
MSLMVVSHWLLDLIVHRPDMPVLPGNLGGLPRLGLGLWTQPLLLPALELSLIAVGSFLYWRTARRVSADAGRSGTWAGACASLVAALGVLVPCLDYNS